MTSDRRFIPQKHLQQMLSDRDQTQKQRAALVDRLRLNASHAAKESPAPDPINSNHPAAAIPDTQIGTIPHPPPVTATACPRLQLQPKLMNEISIVHQHKRLDIPHIVHVIVSMLLGTEETSPICVLLPSTEGIAQFTATISALECLAADFPAARDEFIERQLTPGTRVRALPDGNVFVVGKRHIEHGMDGVFLYYTDKETRETHGCRLVPINQLLRYEPTTRKLPISRASIKLSKSKPSPVDDLAGTRTFANSTLYKTRLILVGSRAEFERALENTRLAPNSASGNGQFETSLADSFAWGTFDSAGKPIVLHPGGSAGLPLVAIARDFIDLETACLSASSEAGSQLVITDRFDLVMRSLDLANRIGERQRLLVLVDARKRSEIEPLRRQGWRIWEPRPWELLQPAGIESEPVKVGVPGIDRIQRSAQAERRPSLGYMEKRSAGLSAAHRELTELGALLAGDAANFDERMQESLDIISSIFFQAANRLSLPMDERLEACVSSIRQLNADRKYIERFLGSQAGAALDGFVAGVESFLAGCRSGNTPKGQAILDLARTAAVDRLFNQVLVTGSRQSREETEAFLTANGLDIRCKLASELTDDDDFPSAVAFSILRRDMFARFIDPWPSRNLVFAGYNFEIDIYKQRLRWRDLQKARLDIDAATRTSLTSLPAAAFGARDNQSTVSMMPSSLDSSGQRDLEAFDSVTGSGDWSWHKRITIPRMSPGEESQDATVLRFVGRSWMAMTEDHRPLCLMHPGSDRTKSAVENVDVSDLHPGARIIVREGGERDVIRAIAQQLCGKDKYDRLRQNASLWREALSSAATDPWLIAKRLEEVGVRRHIVTVRSWLTNSSRIGPRSDDDVLAIAEAFPLPNKTSTDWKGCCDAISELRGLHLSAGMRLTDLLVARCGRMLFEPTETEIAVGLELGVVWILEVAEGEASPRECPSSILNRLQWLDPAWHDRLLKERIRVRGA